MERYIYIYIYICMYIYTNILYKQTTAKTITPLFILRTSVCTLPTLTLWGVTAWNTSTADWIYQLSFEPDLSLRDSGFCRISKILPDNRALPDIRYLPIRNWSVRGWVIRIQIGFLVGVCRNPIRNSDSAGYCTIRWHPDCRVLQHPVPPKSGKYRISGSARFAGF